MQPEEEPSVHVHVANSNQFDPTDILCDPTLRKQLADYTPEVQEQVRRAYILKGPNQPILKFPRTGARAFSQSWYSKYSWIEYSESMFSVFLII